MNLTNTEHPVVTEKAINTFLPFPTTYHGCFVLTYIKNPIRERFLSVGREILVYLSSSIPPRIELLYATGINYTPHTKIATYLDLEFQI